MKEPRTLGLSLIVLGLLVLVGNTTEALPPQAFFAGLLLYPIGGYLFFKGSRRAINRAEARVAGIRAPTLKNESAERYARLQQSNIEANGSVEERIRALRGSEAVSASASSQSTRDREELLLLEADSYDDAEAFDVSSDVSFPIAVQEHDSVAEQIVKLQRLREDGIISDEEMAVAKSKLLS